MERTRILEALVSWLKRLGVSEDEIFIFFVGSISSPSVATPESQRPGLEDPPASGL